MYLSNDKTTSGKKLASPGKIKEEGTNTFYKIMYAVGYSLSAIGQFLLACNFSCETEMDSYNH